jgi:histidinol-phosphate/aromatic aminotransferase/cobyric acid decarboxylase-like protein
VVFNALLKNGILIRDVSSYPMLARGLRVSIGTPEENREFLAALMEAL